jgi:hypothetical protein
MPAQLPIVGSAEDPLPEALGLARAAAVAGLGVKLLGGLAVRVICPDFPPRLRAGQDMDFACLGKGRKDVAAFLERSGCQPDKRFNNLNGDRQMYFNAPSGRPVDVMVNQLVMCHTLDFRPAFGELPFTVSAMDVLLSKLQIVELNEKDAWDIFQLLSGVPLAVPGSPPGAAPGARTPDGPGSGSGASLDPARFAKVVGADWGWWRTVTGSLDQLPGLAAERPQLIPANAWYDPLDQARQLREIADSVPKGMKWKLRANVGDRVRWYELPEEVDH